MSNINVNTITPLAGNSGTVSVSGSLHVRNNISANGTLTFGDANTDNIVLNAEFTSSLIPDLDDKFDIGSSSREWRNLFIDGVAKIDALGSVAGDTSIAYISKLSGSAASPSISASVNIVPGVDNVYNLGSSTQEWKDLFVDGVAKIDSLGSVAEDTNIAYIRELSGSAASPNLSASVNIVPFVDDTYSLGSSTKQWKDLFVDGVAKIDALGSVAGDTNIAYISHLSGSSNLSSISASVNIVPGVDNVYNLGSSTQEWKDLFVDGVAHLDHISAGTMTLDQNIQVAVGTDASFYSINGKRGEIRSQLQGAVAVDTGFTLQLRNTSIAANSLIIANVIGGNGGIITGSVVTANVISANTASFNFFNTGDAAIANDARFTASFAIF